MSIDATRALLDYYRALGVDCAVDAAPHDRFVESARAAPAPPPPREDAEAVAPPRPSSPKIIHAAAEPHAQGLDELRAEMESFPAFASLAATGGFTLGIGRPGPLLAMDLAPPAAFRGAESLVEARGDLLGAMLAAIGPSGQNAYRAYFSPWSATGPTDPETQAALASFARRHLAIAKPKVALLFGNFAKSALMTEEPVAQLYARRFDLRLEDATIVAIPAPGLAALRTTPALKSRAWAALRLAAKLLAEL